VNGRPPISVMLRPMSRRLSSLRHTDIAWRGCRQHGLSSLVGDANDSSRACLTRRSKRSPRTS